MPIDLVIDERDGTSKPDLGDTNNNSGNAHHARASTADTSHTDGSSTPDVVRFPYLSLSNMCIIFLKEKNGKDRRKERKRYFSITVKSLKWSKERNRLSDGEISDCEQV